jgi:uncharacterized membrane protein required for colicin V production
MNWLDIVLFLVIGFAAFYEMTRGFGRAALDAFALYGALWAADALSVPFAGSVRLSPHPSLNHCIAYAVLLLVCGAFSLILSKFVYGMTMINTGMFEGLLGLGAGLGVGMMAAHGLVRVLAMSDPTGGALQTVTESFLGNEMLSFTTYHSVMSTLTNLTAGRHDLPNVNS